MPIRQPRAHWAVTVERNGEQVVCIESNCLSGREINQEDEKTIRTAAYHLLAFIGEATPYEPSAGPLKGNNTNAGKSEPQCS